MHGQSMEQRPLTGQGTNNTKSGGCAASRASADLSAVKKSRWTCLLSLLFACSGTAMRAPVDVASQSELLYASDRQSWGVTQGRGSFSMGPYRIDDVVRHPVRESGYSVFGWGDRRLHASYDFAFSDGVSHRQGHCDQEQDKPSVAYSGQLACRCDAAGLGDASGSSARAQNDNDALRVDIGGEAKEGTLTLGGQTYRMSPLRERESGKQSDEPLGYRIDGAKPLGAVEIEGRIWAQRALDDGARTQLVCMLSGLLLVRPVTAQRPAR
jgi:hypothetical protein